MIINLVYPNDHPDDFADPPEVISIGHHVEVGDAFDATDISANPFAVFSVIGIDGFTCLIEESDDPDPGSPSWSPVSGIAFATGNNSGPRTQFDYGVRTKRWVRATIEYDFLDSADRFGVNVLFGDLDPEAFAAPEPPGYLGRFQQGTDVALVLQCTDTSGTPDDPTYIPWVQIRRDPDAALVESFEMPADLRDVESGLFRKPLFLGSTYSTTGRHVAIFKWLDSNGVSHVETAHFHVLPGGSADGSIIAMCYSSRPDAAYIVFQCDSGRIIRKPNPR